jgi:hypothetical protein
MTWRCLFRTAIREPSAASPPFVAEPRYRDGCPRIAEILSEQRGLSLTVRLWGNNSQTTSKFALSHRQRISQTTTKLRLTTTTVCVPNRTNESAPLHPNLSELSDCPSIARSIRLFPSIGNGIARGAHRTVHLSAALVVPPLSGNCGFWGLPTCVRRAAFRRCPSADPWQTACGCNRRRPASLHKPCAGFLRWP